MKLYFAAIHIVLVALVVHDNVAGRATVRLGLTSAPLDTNAVAAHASLVERVHVPRDLQAPAGAVVFLGDSHTEMLLTSNVNRNSVNHGISGQTSEELLLSLGRYPSLARASVVVLMTGTNDLMQSRAAGIEARYRKILGKIPTGVPVVFNSIPPNNKRDARPVVEAARRACAADPRCTFVDLFAALSGTDGMLRPDGVHMTSHAYTIWTHLLRRAINRPFS